MVENHPGSGATYHAQLADIIKRAEALEIRARKEYTERANDDPEHLSWLRIERRYATIRGNAQHLLIIHARKQQRQQPFSRLLRRLHLL